LTCAATMNDGIIMKYLSSICPRLIHCQEIYKDSKGEVNVLEK
jgi:hypothetical protein